MKLMPKFISKNLKTLLFITSISSIVCFATGLYLSFWGSPIDYQQGDMVRIMYIHVPSAWMALGVYSFMAISSFIYLVWRNTLYAILSINAAPIGAVFALITLVTGSLWGKPIWGTWWVWDARLTSMLILFLFYWGYILLASSLKNSYNQYDFPSILAIVGFVNVPIVKFSVEYWTSLHQKASFLRFGGPSIDPEMLLPLLIMFSACVFFFVHMLIVRYQAAIYEKKYLRNKANLYTY